MWSLKTSLTSTKQEWPDPRATPTELDNTVSIPEPELHSWRGMPNKYKSRNF
jgi:hypothetical protein